VLKARTIPYLQFPIATTIPTLRARKLKKLKSSLKSKLPNSFNTTSSALLKNASKEEKEVSLV
jgi:hypothetical protein